MVILRQYVSHAVILLVASFTSSVAIANAPFGFDIGIHPAKYGFCSSAEDKNVYVCTTAPKPHSKFEMYGLFYSEGIELCRVSAVGNTIENDSYGDKARSIADNIVKQIAKKYGPETHKFDFLRAGSIWNEPSDWMMGILRDERSYVYVWLKEDGYKPVGSDESILLEIEGLSSRSGYIRVAFELSSMPRCVRATNDAESDAF